MMGFNFDIITVVHEATITDWIQAVAALLAVIGTVFTLWKLYERDEQKQAMIMELQKQTGHIAAQVDQLGAQVFQLKNIHEAIAKGIEYMANDEALKVELKKIELRPALEFGAYIPKPGRTDATLHLANKGGTAHDFQLKGLEGTEVTPNFPVTSVRQGDQLKVPMRSMSMMDTNPVFEITYKDELGNRYAQRFDMRHGMPKTGPVIPAETNDETETP